MARAEVGESGKVIGIDFTPAMIDKARANAETLGTALRAGLEGAGEDRHHELRIDRVHDQVDLVRARQLGHRGSVAGVDLRRRPRTHGAGNLPAAVEHGHGGNRLNPVRRPDRRVHRRNALVGVHDKPSEFAEMFTKDIDRIFTAHRDIVVGGVIVNDISRLVAMGEVTAVRARRAPAAAEPESGQ